MYKKGLFLIMFLSLCSCSSLHKEESGLETYNRAMFDFNYKLDKNVMKPIALGYKKITNKFVRQRVSSFFNNLSEPVYFVNNLLQGEVKNSGFSAGRFVINSTLGLLGTFDVAAGWGLDRKKSTFDATLAKYCVPDGPFVVLPLAGPSTPRYVVGWAADTYMSPLYWSLINSDEEKAQTIVWSAAALKYVNLRAENMELLDNIENGSVDFYAAMKSAFMQSRQRYVSLCSQKEEASDVPSYDFDFEEGFDD